MSSATSSFTASRKAATVSKPKAFLASSSVSSGTTRFLALLSVTFTLTSRSSTLWVSPSAWVCSPPLTVKETSRVSPTFMPLMPLSNSSGT